MEPNQQSGMAGPGAGKRKWGFRLALILSPLLLLALTEWGLRQAGYGYATDFFIPMPGEPGMLRENPEFGRRFFPKSMVRAPLPLKVAIEKPPQVLRIIILGESAARGEPDPGYSFGRILGVQLEEQFPDRKVEVINTSVTDINSHVLLPIARECARLHADYWILYAGKTRSSARLALEPCSAPNPARWNSSASAWLPSSCA